MVLIIKHKGYYHVQHRDIEVAGSYNSWKVKTALQALRKASKIESEYGIIFVDI